ncbi:MAG: YceI family protein [Leptospiraceae bacterium]|nr:YceI family protein [Leptospiraceae bacterium]MCP5512613.1 YceI family protein [Leptospiraceae bacterium]
MKNITYLLIIASLAVFNCKKSEPANTTSEAKETKVEVKGTPTPVNVNDSIINWYGAKMSMTHNGTVKLKEGTVYVEGKDVTGGKFTIDMSTIVNLDLDGEMKQKLEGHLRDTDFFEISKFPEVTFQITDVKKKSDTEIDITGNLEMKGISKSISFPATIEYEGDAPKSAKAKVEFDRQIWGITYKGKADDIINDVVKAELDIKL